MHLQLHDFFVLPVLIDESIIVIFLQLPRRVSSNANPVRKYPKTLASVHKKDEHASSSTSVVRKYGLII